MPPSHGCQHIWAVQRYLGLTTARLLVHTHLATWAGLAARAIAQDTPTITPFTQTTCDRLEVKGLRLTLPVCHTPCRQPLTPHIITPKRFSQPVHSIPTSVTHLTASGREL
jgi:hypothetical protein